MLEKTLENSSDCKEIKPVNAKGNHPEYSLEGIFWSWSSNILATWCEESTHWKIFWCWKDWKQEEKGVTEDEIIGWYHWLNGLEFEKTLGNGEGQESLACCNPWGPRVGHDWVTEQQQSMGRTVAEAEALILWPPDMKSWLNGKDPNPGKDWR